MLEKKLLKFKVPPKIKKEKSRRKGTKGCKGGEKKREKTRCWKIDNKNGAQQNEMNRQRDGVR